MQLQKFFCIMPLAGEAAIKPLSNLRLPFWVVAPASPPQVRGQLEALFGREIVNGLFQFGDTHRVNVITLCALLKLQFVTMLQRVSATVRSQ